jgi:hypothetical protein
VKVTHAVHMTVHPAMGKQFSFARCPKCAGIFSINSKGKEPRCSNVLCAGVRLVRMPAGGLA